MIDAVGQIGIQVAEWIVRQRGEMKHRVETPRGQLPPSPDILANFGDFRKRHPKISAVIEIRIESGHFVSGRTKYGPCNGTNITPVACEKVLSCGFCLRLGC